MKIHKSTIQAVPIKSLPKGRAHLTIKGDEGESVWIAIDHENQIMYLLNDTLMFYPFPTWGMELPLRKDIDLYSYRGDNINETEFTVCSETYEALKEYIDENDNFDHTKFRMDFNE